MTSRDHISASLINNNSALCNNSPFTVLISSTRFFMNLIVRGRLSSVSAGSAFFHYTISFHFILIHFSTKTSIILINYNQFFHYLNHVFENKERLACRSRTGCFSCIHTNRQSWREIEVRPVAHNCDCPICASVIHPFVPLIDFIIRTLPRGFWLRKLRDWKGRGFAFFFLPSWRAYGCCKPVYN